MSSCSPRSFEVAHTALACLSSSNSNHVSNCTWRSLMLRPLQWPFVSKGPSRGDAANHLQLTEPRVCQGVEHRLLWGCSLPNNSAGCWQGGDRIGSRKEGHHRRYHSRAWCCQAVRSYSKLQLFGSKPTPSRLHLSCQLEDDGSHVFMQHWGGRQRCLQCIQLSGAPWPGANQLALVILLRGSG